MSARFRCKYCGGPVNAKACGRPLPCPNLGCPCDIGIDPYAHVYRVPEQDAAPLMSGFGKVPTQVFGLNLKVSEHVPEDKIIIVSEGSPTPYVFDTATGTILSPDGAPTPEHVKKEVPLVGWYAYEEVGIHGKMLDPNISRLEHAQRLLWDLYDNTDLDIHEEGCPEDDTCRCPRAMVLNLVMHGWKPPQVTHTGVHCAPPECAFTLQPFPNLHSETAPTEVVMTGQAVGKSSAPQAATDAPPRLVVCAASRNEAGAIAVGARHFDTRMREQMLAFGGRSAWLRAEQGFIDQYGVFLTREEAWKVATAAGQIRRRCGGDTIAGGTLFSENLY